MMIAGSISPRRRRARHAALWLVVLWPLADWAAAPPPIQPTPPNLSSNLPAQTDLSWQIGDLDLIQNGGFESGNLTAWSSAVGPGFSAVLLNDGTDNLRFEGNTPPLDGAYSIVLQQVTFDTTSGSTSISQPLSLPAGAQRLTLRWSDMIRNFGAAYSNDAGSRQGFRVELRLPNNALRQVLFSTEPGDVLINTWTKRSADLTAFAGETLQLAFAVYANPDDFIMSTHVDRISLLVEGGLSPITNEVYFGTVPNVGISQYVGTTTATSWPLPDLSPHTAYYWRVLTRMGDQQFVGPIWRFTTAPQGPLHHFTWSALSSPQPAGGTIQVALTAKDAHDFVVTNFNEATSLTAAAVELHGENQHLLDSAAATALATYRQASVGYAFTPDTTLWVTALRARAGDRVCLWTDGGIRLAHLPLLPNGSDWAEAPLPEPIPLLAGRRYRLSVYAEEPAEQWLRFDGPQVFAHGTLDQAYEGPGDGMPLQPHPARWWFVDLTYQLAFTTTLTVTPAQATGFIDGTWTGSLTLPNQESPLVSLLAQTPAGPAGYANLFALLSIQDTDQDGMPDDWETQYGLNPNNPNDAELDNDLDGHTNRQEYQAGTDPTQAGSLLTVAIAQTEAGVVELSFPSVAGKRYRLQRALTLTPPEWISIGEVHQGTGEAIILQDPEGPSLGNAFYQVLVLP